MNMNREDFSKILNDAISAAADSHSHETIKLNYEKTIISILGQFQLLEFAIKRYIYIFCKNNESQECSNCSEEELDDLALGILIKRYRRVTKNNDFADRIKSLVDLRNEIAHKSLYKIFGRVPFEKTEYFNLTIHYKTVQLEITSILQIVKYEIQEINQH